MGLKTVANITVTRRNLPELRETLAAALLAGATQVFLNRFLPGGRGLQHAAELGLDRNQLADMLRVTEEVLSTAAAGKPPIFPAAPLTPWIPHSCKES